MKSTKIFFLLSYSLLSQWVYSQPPSVPDQGLPFYTQGFKLIYGNTSFSVEDAIPYANQLILECRRTDGTGVEILALGDAQTIEDRLFVRCASARNNFWYEKQKFHFQPFLFYPSEVCDLDYKSGVLTFEYDSTGFRVEGCKELDEEYLIDEYYQSTPHFKIAIIGKERKRSRRNRIGYTINDEYTEEYKVPEVASTWDNYFPYAELLDTLYLLDSQAGTMIKFSQDGTHQILPVTNLPFFQDQPNQFVSYQLIADQASRSLFLLASRFSPQGDEDLRGPDNSAQRLYRWHQGAFEPMEYTLPRYASKLMIRYGKGYAIFPIQEDGTSSDMLFETLDRPFLPAEHQN
ncbi:MAG TPA: hypothetical protein DCE41_15245 [Cytophagales bacterium]|nr:hypothetical protein [Cytophagales bacterium]HAA17938.1 hypothetical protein [Cytophagales bacterium]